MRLELAQRAVVVEEHCPRPRSSEATLQPLLDLTLGVRRELPRSIPARVATQAAEESLRPTARLERLDSTRHRLEPAAALARLELERSCETLDDAVHVPRVDELRSG